MKEAGVVVRSKKKFKVTTNSCHVFPVAPNLLNQNFEVSTPNSVWLGDISYIWTAEGWSYLAVVLDLFSRRIIGWSMDRNMKSELVESALRKALRSRNPPKCLIFHSDRGIQYACDSYRSLLDSYKITQSMSSTGNCYDNSPCERFFRSLKHEQTEFIPYWNRLQAKRDVGLYIEKFDNSRRLHSSLGYQSPRNFELQYLKNAA